MAYWEKPPLKKWKLIEVKEVSGGMSNANQEWDSQTLRFLQLQWLHGGL